MGPPSGLQVPGSAQVPPPHHAGTGERSVSLNTVAPLIPLASGGTARFNVVALLRRDWMPAAAACPSATVSSAAAARRWVAGGRLP